MRIDEDIARVRAILGHINMGTEKAAARAMNRAVNAARTAGVKQIRKTYIIKAKDINRSLKIRKAAPNKLNSSIQVKGSPLPLTLFDAAPLNKDGYVGVVAKVKKEKGKRKEIKGAFMAKATKYEGPFQRVGKKRSPLEPLYGPSLAQMFGSEEVINAMEERGQKVLSERLEHEVERMLGG